MPVVVNEAGPSFTLKGPPFAPTVPSWARATDAARTEFWRQVGVAARQAKDLELARGIGVDGRRLARVRHRRPDGSKGPPLTPHGAVSRCRKWLRHRPGRDGVTLFWSHGWAAIVGYHRSGAGRLPVRDVVGLTEASQTRVVNQVPAIWRRVRRKFPGNHPAASKPAPKPARRGTVPAAARPLARRYPHLDEFLRRPE